MNKKITTAIIWVALLGAIIMMVSGMNPGQKEPDTLDYNTDFLQMARRTETGAATGEEKTIKAIR